MAQLFDKCLTQLWLLPTLGAVQDFVKAVQQESDQVASELEKILAELEPLLQERRRLEQRARALETVMSTYQASQGQGPGMAIAPVPEGTGRHFLDLAYEILKKRGPLYYEDVVVAVQEAGVTVPGRNPGANLIAHMTRDPRFKRTGRGVYAAQS